MKYPVSSFKSIGYSDNWVGLQCVKEFLLQELNFIYKDIKEVESLPIKPYLKNIILAKLNERVGHLRNILNKAVSDMNAIENPKKSLSNEEVNKIASALRLTE